VITVHPRIVRHATTKIQKYYRDGKSIIMPLTRRQFLTLTGGSAAAAVIFQACGVPEEELFVQSPLEMPEDMVTGLQNWYATTCNQCPSGEGIVVKVVEGRAKKIEGNIDHPINQGAHSARCEAGLQALYHPDRIKGPMVRSGPRGSGNFEEISWTDAISRLNLQLGELKQQGNQSQVVVVTDPLRGHIGSLVNRFVDGLGARYMPYEPVDQTGVQEAMNQVWGQSLMPDLDIQNSAYVLSFGSDWLNTWGSPVRYSKGYGEFRQGHHHRGTLIHADSRFSMTAANADQWIHVEPGMEGLLALSIAQVIATEDLGDRKAISALTSGPGFDLDKFAPAIVASKISKSVDPVQMQELINQTAIDFATQHNGPSIAFGGGAVAGQTNGLANLIAIYSLNYIVGSVGKSGGIVFNPTSPLEGITANPRKKSFADWKKLTQDMSDGKVKAMLVRGTDPFYGMPDITNFREASFKVPYIFSFSGVMDDTTAMADLIMPEHNPLESWGTDIPSPGPGYQVVGFQQPVVRPFFESRGEHLGTKDFGDVIINISRELGIDIGTDADSFKDLIQESCKELYELKRGSVSASDFNSFWHGVLQRGGWWDTNATYRASSSQSPSPLMVPKDPVFDGDKTNYPMHLVPFQSTSLTDGRGAALPWLQATPDPISTATWSTWAEINDSVAKENDIKEGDVIKISSTHGSIEAISYPNPATPFDVISVPIGQGHRESGRYAKDRGSNVLSILGSDTDESGNLAWGAVRVSIEKTGNWIRLPKFENHVPSHPEDDHQEIIKIAPDSSKH